MQKPAKKYPPVVIVDENDNEIGSAMLTEVWQKGLYHRVVSVFIIDDKGRMLLQRRGPNVGIHPNSWDQAAAGHVDAGDTYEQAAKTEVAEELGIQSVTLKLLATFPFADTLEDGRTVKGFERTYLMHVPHDVVLKPEPEEVSELRWFTPAELKTQIKLHAATFTPGLLYCLRTYFPSFVA